MFLSKFFSKKLDEPKCGSEVQNGKITTIIKNIDAQLTGDRSYICLEVSQSCAEIIFGKIIVLKINGEISAEFKVTSAKSRLKLNHELTRIDIIEVSTLGENSVPIEITAIYISNATETEINLIFFNHNDETHKILTSDGWSGHYFIAELPFITIKNCSKIIIKTLGYHPYLGDIEKIGLSAFIGHTQLKYLNFSGDDYFFEIPNSFINYQRKLNIIVKCLPFSPSEVGIGSDNRKLGLDILAIEAQDKDNSTLLNVFTNPNVKKSCNSEPMKLHISQLRSQGATIGHHTSIHAGTVLDPSHMWLIEIGNYVTIATGCFLIAHDASTNNGFLNHTRIGMIVIEDFVFVGVGSIILPGVKVGQNSIIGAGSVVTKSVPKNVVVAGNPAKILCSVDDFRKNKSKEFSVSEKFDQSYSLENGITSEMIQEVKSKIASGFGYIV